MSPKSPSESTETPSSPQPSVDALFTREMSAAIDLAARSGDIKSVLAEIVQSVQRTSRADEVWFALHEEALWGEVFDAKDEASYVRVQGEDFGRDCRNPLSMIAQDCHFSRPDVWTGGSQPGLAESPQWQDGDWFKFPLWSADGRMMACLVVDGTSDGRLLDEVEVAKIALLAKLASVAIARKGERMHFERLSERMRQRAYLLEDVLTISSSIVSERNLDNLSKMILSSVSSLFGFERVALVVYDEEAGAFRWKALFGYPEDVTRFTLARTIPADAVLDELVPANRISRSAYHVPFENMPDE